MQLRHAMMLAPTGAPLCLRQSRCTRSSSALLHTCKTTSSNDSEQQSKAWHHLSATDIWVERSLRSSGNVRSRALKISTRYRGCSEIHGCKTSC